jgi:hypothetical protein
VRTNTKWERWASILSRTAALSFFLVIISISRSYAQLDDRLLKGTWINDTTGTTIKFDAKRFIYLYPQGKFKGVPLASYGGRGRVVDCTTGGGNLCFEMQAPLKCAMVYDFSSGSVLHLNRTGEGDLCEGLDGTYSLREQSTRK